MYIASPLWCIEISDQIYQYSSSAMLYETLSLRWRHNELDSVSNHQPRECLLSRLFGRRSKKTSKLRVTGLCAGNSPGTGEFPAQRASNAENVSIWWRHHDGKRNQITTCLPKFKFHFPWYDDEISWWYLHIEGTVMNLWILLTKGLLRTHISAKYCWFGWWLGAWSTPSHHPTQLCDIYIFRL